MLETIEHVQEARIGQHQQVQALAETLMGIELECDEQARQLTIRRNWLLGSEVVDHIDATGDSIAQLALHLQAFGVRASYRQLAACAQVVAKAREHDVHQWTMLPEHLSTWEQTKAYYLGTPEKEAKDPKPRRDIEAARAYYWDLISRGLPLTKPQGFKLDGYLGVTDESQLPD